MNRKDFLKATIGVVSAPLVIKDAYGSVKGCVILNTGGDRFAPGSLELPKPYTVPMHAPMNHNLIRKASAIDEYGNARLMDRIASDIIMI